jgi:hypothetical protein
MSAPRSATTAGEVIEMISLGLLPIELGVVGLYFGGMSLLGLLSPVFDRTDFLIAQLVHVAAAVLCLVSLI